MNLDVLAVGAHPDDAELFCGGTLIGMASRGYQTGVLSLTKGELGTRGTPEVREEEFREAAEILKVQTHDILTIPDGQVDSSWDNKLKVVHELRRTRPSVVLCPYWDDRHPDHQNSSSLVRESTFLAALPKVETDKPPHRVSSLIYYPCWHEFTPTFIVDITDHHQQKVEAILAYKSQFHHPEKVRYGDVETPVSEPKFLERIISRAKHLGSIIGVPFGEGFLVRQPLRMDDPVAFLGRANESLD